MEKIILVFHINVKHLEITDVSSTLNKIAEDVNRKNPELTTFFIPVFDSETRIECINPKLISKDEYLNVKRILEENQEIVNNLIKNGIS